MNKQKEVQSLLLIDNFPKGWKKKIMVEKAETKVHKQRKFLLFIEMIVIAAGVFLYFAAGIKFLNYLDEIEQKLASALFAIVWGVSAVAFFYYGANWIVERFSPKWTERIQPYIFVGPAVIILLWALAIPTLRTLIYSLKDANAKEWIGLTDLTSKLTPDVMIPVYQKMTGGFWFLVIVLAGIGLIFLFKYLLQNRKENEDNEKSKLLSKKGLIWILIFGFLALYVLIVPVIKAFTEASKGANVKELILLENYKFAFTDPQMLIVFRNNLLWLILGTFFCVFLGLIIAVLTDRSKFERIYKAIIFTPMAISFVGAGVIWKFIYNYKGQGNETGLLNAIIIALGGTAKAWLQIPFWNNIFLIVIMVWLQTGYCMVILSSAIKGISSELLEAARIDGANEFQIFFRIIIPVIKGSIIAVTTTVLIFSLKTFDVVRAMTGGQYGTNVIANEFFNQRFVYYDKGRASAIAIVLLVLVIPVMYFNLKQFNERKAF